MDSKYHTIHLPARTDFTRFHSIDGPGFHLDLPPPHDRRRKPCLSPLKIRISAGMRLLAFCCWLMIAAPPAVESQETAAETPDLSSLRALLEQQTRQLNSLQDRVLRLQEMVALLLARPTTSAASPLANPAAPTAPTASASSVDPGSGHSSTAPTLPQALSTSSPALAPGTISPQPPSPLSPPEASQPAAHVPQHLVEKGQTLISIARQHGVSVSDLQKLNKIEDVKKLQVGQRLLLPYPTQKTP